MVYVVVVYDMEANRTEILKKYLRQRLNHVQNSVFDGRITEGELENIKTKIQNEIHETENVLIYKSPSQNMVERIKFGSAPDDTNII